MGQHVATWPPSTALFPVHKCLTLSTKVKGSEGGKGWYEEPRRVRQERAPAAAGEQAKPRGDAQLHENKDVFPHPLCSLVLMLFLRFSVCKIEENSLYLTTVLEGLIHVCEVLSDLKLEGMRKHRLLL